MLFGTPQFIDVEDKIVGPFTGKALLWMFVLGVFLMILWNLLTVGIFLVVAIPSGLFFLALAFYRPYNQPLINFIFSAGMFFFRPKIYIWKKEGREVRKNEIKTAIKNKDNQDKKEINQKKIEQLAAILDKRK
jgi:predicted membrane protein